MLCQVGVSCSGSMLTCLLLHLQGHANMNGDFFFKEFPDGSICLESSTCPGVHVAISIQHKKQAKVTDTTFYVKKVVSWLISTYATVNMDTLTAYFNLHCRY